MFNHEKEKKQSHHEGHEVNEENTCSQQIYAVTPHTFADYWFSLLYLCITFMSFMVKQAVLCVLCELRGKNCISLCLCAR